MKMERTTMRVDESGNARLQRQTQDERLPAQTPTHPTPANGGPTVPAAPVGIIMIRFAPMTPMELAIRRFNYGSAKSSVDLKRALTAVHQFDPIAG